MTHYAGVYEHSPWVAERAWATGRVCSCRSVTELTRMLANVVDAASHDEQLKLLRAHPDLAGKAALAGTLTDDSNAEQASAGLDGCTADELARFHQLNEAYTTRFEFPFIKAVRFSNRHDILKAFEERLKHSTDEEFATALSEVHTIARWRIEAMHQESQP